MITTEASQLRFMSKAAILIMACLVPLTLLAFWPLYLSKPFGDADRYTHLHAVTGTLWLLVLIVQPLTIHKYRYALHRTIGFVSYFLAPLFFVAGILLSNHRLRSMDEAAFAAEGFSHFLPFYASLIFAAAYCLGVLYRKLPEAHGRFMLLTAIPLIDPVLGRILFFYFPSLPHPLMYQGVGFSLGTILAAVMVFSYKGERSAKRSLIAYFVLLVVLEIGWFTLAQTGAWLSVVSWFRSMPLT
jgi:hypothetical protein